VALGTDDLKATLDPYGTSSKVLASKTKYKAIVTTGAKDVAGNACSPSADYRTLPRAATSRRYGTSPPELT
jgi:hypothetical protein